MATIFLEEPTEALAQVDGALETSPSDTSAQLALRRKLLVSLQQAQLEVTLTLDATSDAADYRQLDAFIRHSRDSVYSIIKSTGSLALDAAPLRAAKALVGAISGFVLLREHLSIRHGQEGGIGCDVSELDALSGKIDQRMAAYITEVDKIFQKYLRG